MKTTLTGRIYNFSKAVFIACSILTIVHILLIIPVLLDINLTNIFALDEVAYPNEMLMSRTIRNNFTIDNKFDPSKNLEVAFGAVQLYVDTNHHTVLMLVTLLKRIIYLLFFTIISYAFRNMFKNFQQGIPFVTKSVKQLRIIAYAFIILCPLMLLYDYILQLSLINYVMSDGTRSGVEIRGYGLNIQYLFYGLVILAFSQVFQHGAMLQNEYDQTI